MGNRKDKRGSMQTLICGDIFRPSSFANVNMHMAYYLIKMGLDLGVLGRYLGDQDVEPLIERYMPHKPDAKEVFKGRVFGNSDIVFDKDIKTVINFCVSPQHFDPVSGKKNICFTVWSHDNYPSSWAKATYRWDEIWTPSLSNFAAIVDAGGSHKNLRLVPHGYEPDIFYPVKKEKNDKMVFGMCNAICYFKGADLAITSFLEYFNENDKVELKIMSTDFKRSPDHKEDRHGVYHAQYKEYLRRYNKNIKTSYIEKDSSLSEMADFYRSCDCILTPHRGDGFGLVGLEAMACGVPIIVSNYHGPKDYIRPDYPYFINGSMKQVSAGIPHFPDGGSSDEKYFYFEPDKTHLKTVIGLAYNNWLMDKQIDLSDYFVGLTWEKICSSIFVKGDLR
jgi:glycosyltransferase involved in cell wall biosynthesis